MGEGGRRRGVGRERRGGGSRKERGKGGWKEEMRVGMRRGSEEGEREGDSIGVEEELGASCCVCSEINRKCSVSDSSLTKYSVILSDKNMSKKNTVIAESVARTVLTGCLIKTRYKVPLSPMLRLQTIYSDNTPEKGTTVWYLQQKK